MIVTLLLQLSAASWAAGSCPLNHPYFKAERRRPAMTSSDPMVSDAPACLELRGLDGAQICVEDESTVCDAARLDALAARHQRELSDAEQLSAELKAKGFVQVKSDIAAILVLRKDEGDRRTEVRLSTFIIGVPTADVTISIKTDVPAAANADSEGYVTWDAWWTSLSALKDKTNGLTSFHSN